MNSYLHDQKQHCGQALMSYPKFQIYRVKNNQLYYQLYAHDGQIMLDGRAYGEAHKFRASCENSIRRIKEHACNEQSYMRKVTKNGWHYFSLCARNGMTLAISKMYLTSILRDEAMALFKDIVPHAPIEDVSQLSWNRYAGE